VVGTKDTDLDTAIGMSGVTTTGIVMMIGITNQGDTPANTTRSSSGRAFQQLFERLHNRMTEIFCADKVTLGQAA
jgi:hypothetical protein